MPQSNDALYISEVRKELAKLPNDVREAVVIVLTLVDGSQREFHLALALGSQRWDQAFLTEYFRAEVYNLLINLGGQELALYLDTSNDALVSFVESALTAFHVDRPTAERKGYGIAVNVIDRMLRSLKPGSKFRFLLRPRAELPAASPTTRPVNRGADIFTQVSQNLSGKAICGIDIGGSDIKAVLSVDGRLVALKEYDWFPEKYSTAEEIIDPILLMVRLLRASAALSLVDTISDTDRSALLADHARVIDKDAGYHTIKTWVDEAEGVLGENLPQLDAVGLCFPDVVVKDKVVGGEVTKTRGMRDNPDLDYETEFTKLTNLDERLLALCKQGAVVKNTNDGPMAAFTAAVELAAGEAPDVVKKGIFAHTLGTELGTGWVTAAGSIPEIPLETYNLILDLGSGPEKEYPADDVRSVNNFNTGLQGSIQRYTSQSGVFRLALKLLTGCRDDLVEGFYERGYLATTTIDGKPGIEVPVKPKDMRKAFLEHIMSLVESESDECVKDIFREVGRAMGIAWYEAQRILEPECRERILFGRLVKRKECFRLMTEGATSLYPQIAFSVADEELANTDLMTQLAQHPHYTVAQFAQAIGAVYYGHMGIIEQEILALQR